VCSPQWFAADESLEGFDAQCKFAAGQGTLGSDASGTRPIEIPRQQVLGAPTLDGGLSKSMPPFADEVERLDHHPFIPFCRP
jgi:hypothetical protein